MNRLGLSLIFIFIVCSTTNVGAQINIQTGYSFGYFPNQKINSYLAHYNTADNQHELEQRFNKIKTLHGFVVGADMRFSEILAVFAQWTQKTKSSEAYGYDGVGEANLEIDITNRIDVFSLGFDNHFQNYSIGATIDFNNFRVIERINNARDRMNLSQKYFWSSTLFFSVSLPSNDALSFQIRPYVQIPWGNVDLGTALPSSLDVPDLSDNNTYPLNFGISLIFNNGPQYYY